MIRVLVVASTLIVTLFGGSIVLMNESADSQDGHGDLTSRGRIVIPIISEGWDEAAGKPVSWVTECAADAVVRLEGRYVLEIRRSSERPVDVGEEVDRLVEDSSFGPVYRDATGRLKEGCAPESKTTILEDDSGVH